MSRLMVTDLTHFLNEAGSVAELTARAKPLVAYLGSIVRGTTESASGHLPDGAVRCRRRPGRKRCPGKLEARIEPKTAEIHWRCPVCWDGGTIDHWEGTPWDGRTAVAEWIGGHFTAPFFITEGTPYRPDVLFWIEMPEMVILATNIIGPEDQDFSDAGYLRQTMLNPAVGPPRRPARLRVADENLAMELKGAFPEIEIVVAPTLELDEIFEHFTKAMSRSAEQLEGYTDGGRISSDAFAALFRAAGILYGVAPWERTPDDLLIRVDIPSMDIEAGCISIIGSLGESLGFLLFPSIDGCEAFGRAAKAAEPGSRPADLGTSFLSLSFERGADLHPEMRREIARHDWPVRSPDAYPDVDHRERDGTPRPLTEKDVRVVSACALSLSSLFAKHGYEFESGRLEPISESWLDDDDQEVRFTVPHSAGPLFGLREPPPRYSWQQPHKRNRPKVSRNAPCPCGSGKKYKKCCMGK